MTSNHPAIGFGQLVTGGGNVTAISVTSADELRARVKSLDRRDEPTVIELNGTSDYDLGGRTLNITGRNLTIRAGTRAVLNDVRLAIDLDHASNILIQDVIFRNNGSDRGNRDAITMEVSDPPRNATSSDQKAQVRITHCAFNGYFDIAIDTKSAIGRPRLFATIDHCLFFDERPGLKGSNNSDFFNRGAINFSARSSHNSDSRATIANNVFVNVWRRSPRVAGGNFVHVLNNLLYHPGFTAANSPNPNNATWRGIEVGGGDRDPDGSQALIQANRFIPTPNKLGVITTNPTTETDISDQTGATLFNAFNDPDGAAGTPLTLPAGRTAVLDPNSFYSNRRPAPTVLTAAEVPWSSVVQNAGSPVADDLQTAARNIVLDVLTAAGG